MTLKFSSDGKFYILRCQLHLCLCCEPHSKSCISAFEFRCTGKEEVYIASNELSLEQGFSPLWPENLGVPGRLSKLLCRTELGLRQQDPGSHVPAELEPEGRGPPGIQRVTSRTPGRTHPALSFISANGISRSMTSHKYQP